MLIQTRVEKMAGARDVSDQIRGDPDLLMGAKTSGNVGARVKGDDSH